MFCKWCDEGNEPAVLDVDGVLSSVSGNPGCWCHSEGDSWWPCYRKAAEEHAIVAKLPVWIQRIESANEALGDTVHAGLFRQDISEVTKEITQAAESAAQEARGE